jgi:ferredoxin-NADP reductase
VLSVYLAGANGERLPQARAGQYLTVRVGELTGGPVRSYSLSAADSDGYRVSVKREPGGSVSPWIHDHFTEGSTIDAAAPSGTFCLDESTDRPVVLLSAGIGVTPVLAILHELAAQRTRREVWWIHTTRDAAHHAFAEEAEQLLSQLAHKQVHVYYSRAVDDVGRGRPGRVDPKTIAELGIPTTASAYICGPSGFTEEMRQAMEQVGLAADRIHSERFGAADALNPGIVDAEHRRPHLPEGEPGRGPVVTFARSGLAVAWDGDKYRSLLELAEACDVPTRWSCRTGVCHTCATQRLSGDARYVTAPMTLPPGDEVLICSAVPTTDTVLDA